MTQTIADTPAPIVPEPGGAAPRTEPPRRRRRRAWGVMSRGERISRYVLLLVVLFITVGPFLWQLSTSLKGSGEDILSLIHI